LFSIAKISFPNTRQFTIRHAVGRILLECRIGGHEIKKEQKHSFGYVGIRIYMLKKGDGPRAMNPPLFNQLALFILAIS
jgi:hypothetical protein